MTMPETVALKLDRAKEHVETLQCIHDEFLATEPYEAQRIIKVPLDGKGTQHILFWGRCVRPPRELPLVLGDAIHNLRSALDHLAFALAQHGAHAHGVTMTQEQEARIQFPIVLTPYDFEEQIERGRLKFVESQATAAIETCQPYQLARSYPPRAFPAIINRLDITDKRQALHVAGIVTEIYREDWPNEVRDTQLEHPPGGRRSEVGAQIGSFNFPTPQSEMDVPLRLRYGLMAQGAWPSSHGLCDLLRTYINSIETTIIYPIARDFLP